jgi:hypothetical protein
MVARTSGTAVVISNSIDVTDRAARLLGKAALSIIGTTQVSLAGNVTLSFGNGVTAILKTCTITTNATAGNRQLGTGVGNIASKLVGPTTGAGDLLDRELPLTSVGGVDLQITGGLAGDTWITTRIQVI